MISRRHLAVLHALADRRDARIVVAVDVECPAHPGEVVIGGRRHDSPAVGEAHRPEAGDEARELRPVGLEQHLVRRGVGPQERDDGVHHRKLDVLAALAALPCVQRGADRLRRVQRRHLVGGGLPQEHRDAVVGIGLVRGEAAVRLDHGVVGAAIAVRAGRAEPGERHVHDVGVDRAHVVVAEPELVHHARPEVLDQHVGVGREPAHDVEARRRLQIDRDRALPAVAHEIQRAHPVDADADPPRDVTDARPFDLDHRRALVGHQRGRVRPGERDRQVEDAHAVERPAHSANSVCRRGRPSGPL